MRMLTNPVIEEIINKFVQSIIDTEKPMDKVRRSFIRLLLLKYIEQKQYPKTAYDQSAARYMNSRLRRKLGGTFYKNNEPYQRFTDKTIYGIKLCEQEDNQYQQWCEKHFSGQKKKDKQSAKTYQQHDSKEEQQQQIYHQEKQNSVEEQELASKNGKKKEKKQIVQVQSQLSAPEEESFEYKKVKKSTKFERRETRSVVPYRKKSEVNELQVKKFLVQQNQKEQEGNLEKKLFKAESSLQKAITQNQVLVKQINQLKTVVQYLLKNFSQQPKLKDKYNLP